MISIEWQNHFMFIFCTTLFPLSFKTNSKALALWQKCATIKERESVQHFILFNWIWNNYSCFFFLSLQISVISINIRISLKKINIHNSMAFTRQNQLCLMSIQWILFWIRHFWLMKLSMHQKIKKRVWVCVFNIYIWSTARNPIIRTNLISFVWFRVLHWFEVSFLMTIIFSCYSN